MIHHKGRKYGFEIKYQDAPVLSKSMHHVIKDLNLVKLWVVYPGKESYLLKENIAVLPFEKIQKALQEMNQ